MRNVYLFFIAMAVAAALNSCSTPSGSVRCPDMSAKHIHRPVMVKKNYFHAKQSRTTIKKETADTRQPVNTPFLAFLKQEVPISTSMPTYLQKEIESSGNFEKVNQTLGKFSQNKVSLSLNREGKMVLNASEYKALNQVAKQVVFKKPAQRMSDEARDILALIGGILGIVSISTSWIPFFNFLSIFVGVGGLVLGILGSKSENRKKWAILGIVLGSIGIALSIAFIILYSLVWFAWI